MDKKTKKFFDQICELEENSWKSVEQKHKLVLRRTGSMDRQVDYAYEIGQHDALSFIKNGFIHHFEPENCKCKKHKPQEEIECEGNPYCVCDNEDCKKERELEAD